MTSSLRISVPLHPAPRRREDYRAFRQALAPKKR
jgi:hypothetical protein